MAIQLWEHRCVPDGRSALIPNPICEKCGQAGNYRGWYPGNSIEAMARYQRLYGLPPIGPHRGLADQLFAGAVGRCPHCEGRGEVLQNAGRLVSCPACVLGHVVLWSPQKMAEVRARIWEQFPSLAPRAESASGSVRSTPGTSQRPPRGPFADLDEQTLIDALVFEAWRRGDDTRSRALGQELTSRWDQCQGGEECGILLEFSDEIIDDDVDPADYIDAVPEVSPARRAAVKAGAEPTEEELERCRDIAVEAHFGNPEAGTWEVVALGSRAGHVAYLAHILRGDYPCESEFVGVFRSVDAAVDGLKTHGYVSLEHYRIQRGRRRCN